MSDSLDRIGGSLINIVLGALILWVGQTTYRHAGQLAGMDQKFATVDEQVKAVSERYDSLRSWLDRVVNGIKDDSRMQFTTDDAEKLSDQLRKLDEYTYHVEQRITERLNAAEIKLATLEARDVDGRQLAELQTEVAQLRSALSQPISSPEPAYQYQPASNVAQGVPTYLPPVNGRR